MLLEATRMRNFHSKMTSYIVMGLAAIVSDFSLAQSQTAPTQSGQPNQVSIVYVPPQNSAFQPLYDLLRESCPGENSGDIKPIAIARAADRQGDRMRRGKFLLPETKLQTDRDDLLRASEAHFRFCPK